MLFEGQPSSAMLKGKAFGTTYVVSLRSIARRIDNKKSK